MEPASDDQQIIFRAYQGRDLAEAQRRAWAEQPDAFLAGYVSAGQQWDETSRTLTVRYERRAPGHQASPSTRPPADQKAATPPYGQTPMVGRPQLRWADNKPLPRWRIAVGVVIVAALGAGALVAANLEAFDQRPKTVIAAGTDTGPVPRIEPATCRGIRFGTAVLRCGDLVVPEDRDRPNGSRIRLHYAVYPAEGGATEPDPVVYLDGGPGSSPLSDGFPIDPFVQQRDLVVFDQRGTGQSLPSLDCPEIDGVSLDGTESDHALAIRACRDRLRAEGVDRTQYTSAESATDVEDLRTVLGYPAWNLYGISYGTRLALTVMRDHPAGVRSAILDSVYPPSVDGYLEQGANAERAFELLFGACERQPSCARAYPGLRQTFDGAVAVLDRDRPRVRVTPPGGVAAETTLDGDVLIDFVFQNLYRTEVIPTLPRAIVATAGGDHAALTAHLADEEPPRGRPAGSDTESEGVELSVQCAEELPFAQVVPTSGEVSRIARTFGIGSIQGACAMWDVPSAPPLEREAVTSEIPTLLLAGEFDPITPPAWAEAAAKTLSRGHVLTFRGVGHGVLNTSACADGLVSAFLLDPMSPPNGRCMEHLQDIVFVVP
ncbi:MAG: alpha/beta hydrolase [Chloroflexi bacterium]|nr:alpha/beta hydrolase [Chloroflexota bacterium]